MSNNTFRSNVSTLFSGSLFAQVVNLLLLYLLTRLYPTTVIGEYFIFSALQVIVANFVSLQSNYTILLGQNNEEYSDFLRKSIQLCLGVGVLFLPIAFIGVGVAKIVHVSGNSLNIYLLLPFSSLGTALNQNYENYLTAVRKYDVIRNGRIAKALLLFIFQVCFVSVFESSIWLLVFGLIASQWLVFIYFHLLIKSIDLFDFSGMLGYLSRFRNIFFYNSSIAGLNVLSNQLPILLIGSYYTNLDVAHFGMAFKIAAIPFGLMGSNIGQVFFERSAKLKSQHLSIRPLLLQTYRSLWAYGAIPVCLVFLFASWGINTFMGDEWLDSIILVRIVLFWVYISYVTTSIDSLATTLTFQKQMAWYQLFLLIFRVGVIILGALSGISLVMTVVIFVLVTVLFNLFNHSIIFKNVGRYEQMILRFQ